MGSDEQRKEIETLETKMKEDLQQRREKVEQLRRDVSEDVNKLRQIEEALAIVTIEYDEITEREKKEADEVTRQRAEEHLRERAAIRIQRWFRVFLLRTIKSRKKRKKAKRKVSKEVRKDPIEESHQMAQDQTLLDGDLDEVKDISDLTRTAVAVLVSRKSAGVRKPITTEVITLTEDHSYLDKTGPSGVIPYGSLRPKLPSRSKKTASAIQSITVKKNKHVGAKTTPVENESKANPIVSLNRSSQTDNRVPKSKQTFR